MIKALTVTGLLLLGYDAADLIITGIAVLAVVILLIAFWLAGGFTKDFWIEEDDTAARIAAYEEEADRAYPPIHARTVNHWYEDVTDYPEARS